MNNDNPIVILTNDKDTHFERREHIPHWRTDLNQAGEARLTVKVWDGHEKRLEIFEGLQAINALDALNGAFEMETHDAPWFWDKAIAERYLWDCQANSWIEVTP